MLQLSDVTDRDLALLPHLRRETRHVKRDDADIDWLLLGTVAQCGSNRQYPDGTTRDTRIEFTQSYVSIRSDLHPPLPELPTEPIDRATFEEKLEKLQPTGLSLSILLGESDCEGKIVITQSYRPEADSPVEHHDREVTPEQFERHIQKMLEGLLAEVQETGNDTAD